MTADGYPDYDAIVAAGGSVRGVIRPDGSPMVQHVNGSGSVTEYAAIVDRGDGSAPFLISGGDASAGPSTTSTEREDLLNTLQSLLDAMPATLAQAQAWSKSNDWPVWQKHTGSPPSGLSAVA